MSQTILTATNYDDGEPQVKRFYVNVPAQRYDKIADANAFAGTDGHVLETRRERLNDYVGPAVWGDEQFVAEWNPPRD